MFLVKARRSSSSGFSLQRRLSKLAEIADVARGRELSLDVVRGLAILLAMGYHINRVDAGPVANILLQPGAKIGWAGVDLFFVLSGFLIGGLILKEVNLTGRFDYKRFLIRRVLRLWPTLYTFLVAMLLFGFPARDFFWQISLHVQNYVPSKSATHLWSLAVEEQFYLLLAVGFPILAYAYDWRKVLPCVLIGIVVLCPVLRAIGTLAGYSHRAIYEMTHFRIDTLAAGLLLAFLASAKPEFFRSLLRQRMIWAAIAGLGSIFLWRLPQGSALGNVVGYSVSWIASAATILVLYQAPVLLSWRRTFVVIAFLGQISYPLYLWHVAVLKMAQAYLPRLGIGPGAFQIFFIYLGAVAIAFLVTSLVERPTMRLRDNIFPKRRQVAVPGIPA